ncbi:MAG: hypothetical protein ACSHXB_20745 [Sulfitobacter sp.]
MKFRDFADHNVSLYKQRHKALTKAFLNQSGVQTMKPTSELGLQAQKMVVQSASVAASVTAVSSYTNLLIQTSVAPASFTTTPSATPGITSQELSDAYEIFQEQWANMQGTAAQWLSSPAGGASIYSQLSSVPTGVTNIDPSVQSYLTQLASLEPGSSAYEQDLTNLENLVSSEIQMVQGLSTVLADFSSAMQADTENVITQCETGTIAEVIAAYDDEIDSLNDSIASLNSEIASDNNQLIADYVGLAAECTTAVIGLSMLWNPVGWFALGSAAIGLYETSTDIMSLNAEIASDQAQLNTQMSVVSTDTSQVAQLQAFATQVQGFDEMNALAQQELTTLINLYQDLLVYLQTMNQDLSDEDISAASDEWTVIMSSAGELTLATLYTWPTRTQVYVQNTLAANNSGAFMVTPAGNILQSGFDQNGWTDTGECGVSIAAAGDILISINGAPVDSSVTMQGYTTDYYIHQFSNGTWSAISNFAASNIATDGTVVYCTKYDTTGTTMQYVYKYENGSWSQLPVFPIDGDFPVGLAVSNGVLFARGNNTGLIYSYDGSWQQVSPNEQGAVSLSASNADQGFLAYIDTQQTPYLYNCSTQQSPPEASSASSVIAVAQSDHGAQYQIGADQSLNYSIVASGQPTTTSVGQNAIAITSSPDNGKPVYGDNLGGLFFLNGATGASNTDWVAFASTTTENA